MFSRVAQGAEQAPARFIGVRLETRIHYSRVSCLMRRHCGLTSRLFPLPQHVPSLLFPTHSAEQPHDPRTGGQSGRLAAQSPPTHRRVQIFSSSAPHRSWQTHQDEIVLFFSRPSVVVPRSTKSFQVFEETFIPMLRVFFVYPSFVVSVFLLFSVVCCSCSLWHMLTHDVSPASFKVFLRRFRYNSACEART